MRDSGLASGESVITVMAGRRPLSALKLTEAGDMSQQPYQLPETLIEIVRADREYSIYLLQGRGLIFFPD